MKYILSIDQGTTSTRAILFNNEMKIEAISQKEFPQYFPQSGWVEHNPEDIYETVLDTCKNVLKKAKVKASDVLSIGITNQRETTLVWDKETGKTIYNAIVWQDRRSSKYCMELKEQGYESIIKDKTGLLIDSYFSATKLRWILLNVPKAKKMANKGNLLFGTVDSFLIWRLTGKHLTDATNAARTMLYNIKTNEWDKEICEILDIPMNMLPEVKDCADDYGKTKKEIFKESISVNAVAGDQQSATIGQACFKEGMIKSTYGTGCFALLNTGENIVYSNHRLLTTIAYRINGKTTYALEGSIFIAGSVVQWLRDGLKIIKKAKEAQRLAKKSNFDEKIYLVPAFTGLGAPYWDSTCRGAIYGITRNTTRKDIARAALESVAYQTKDLIEAMYQDWQECQGKLKKSDFELRVDGGMSASKWTMKFLANMLGIKVIRPKILETTALGVAWLAGMKIGFYPKKEKFSNNWELDKTFKVNMDEKERELLYKGWKDSISRTLT